MTDVSVVDIDEMETIYEGIARRARRALGVSAWVKGTKRGLCGC